MKQKFFFGTIILLILFGFGSLSAQHDSTLNCNARLIRATNASVAKIDPQLSDIKIKLTKDPFRSFNCFTLYSSNNCFVIKGKPPVKIMLEGGAIMNLEYKSNVVTNLKTSYVISYSVVDISGKTTSSSKFTIDNGETIILALGKVNAYYSFIVLKFTK